jgi:hypothetical protein
MNRIERYSSKCIFSASALADCFCGFGSGHQAWAEQFLIGRAPNHGGAKSDGGQYLCDLHEVTSYAGLTEKRCKMLPGKDSNLD